MISKMHASVPGFTLLALLALSACGGSGGGGPGGTPGGTTSGGTGTTGGTSTGGTTTGGTTTGGTTTSGGTTTGGTTTSGGTTTGGTTTSGGTTSGGTTTGGTTAFIVPNPYASSPTSGPDRLDRLVVFGDSYSDPSTKRSCKPGVAGPCIEASEMWSSRLAARAGAALDTYAQSSASATDPGIYGADLSFAHQVDQFEGDASPLGANDLTVVYMGYNDISKPSASLDKAAADYAAQLDRLIQAGATRDEARVFLTLVHDWSTIPDELANPTTAGRTQTLNGKIAGLANARDNVVAVDLYTVVERIRANPERYGFTNVRTADPAKAGSTALYFDGKHFGARGQEIIAEVYAHYLGRGWDWANALAAGGKDAQDRLNADIDAGRLLAADAAPALGLTSFGVGTPGAAPLASEDPSRAGFAALRAENAGAEGVGLAYALDGDTRFGLAFTQRESASESGIGHGTTNLRQSSEAVSFLFDTKAAGLVLQTKASFSDDRHTRREADGLVGGSTRADFNGRTTAFSQTAALPKRLGGAVLTPWVNLSHTVQEVDGFTIANPYLSDLTYSGASVAETYATVGLNFEAAPIDLGRDRGLRLTGGLTWSRSLGLDDYEVRVTEARFGNASTETIGREPVSVLGLTAGAEMTLGKDLSLSADYALAKQDGADVAQNLMLRLSHRF